MAGEKEVKEKESQHRLGYIGLGICLDYFIFRPVRKLSPVFFFCSGIVCGMIFTVGIDNIVQYVKSILV